MNITAIRNSLSATYDNQATLRAAEFSAASSQNSSSLQVRSNTSSAASNASSDNIAVSSNASAISSNSSLNSVLSDIMGPRNGNSGAEPWPTSAASPASAVDDPAARFRSAEKVPLEGYNQTKLDNPEHKTPKYIFGRVAQGFSLETVKGDKSRAEEILKAMVFDLKAAGLEIVGVKGDRIQVKTEVGYEWVDVVHGAGNKEKMPGWHWGSEGKGTPNPTSSPDEWARLTGQTGNAGAAGGGAGGGGAAAGAGGGTAAAPMSAGGAVASGPKFTPLGSQIDRDIVESALKKYPVGNQGLAQGCQDLQQHYPGVSVIPHANTQDKLKFPNGAVIDVIIASKTPNPRWGYLLEN